MKGNPVTWFEIYVQEMDRAKKFYETVFEVTLQKLEAPAKDIELWSFPADMSKYGAGGAIVKMAKMPSAGNSTVIYFHSEDCANEEARVIPAGGQVIRPKMSIGEYGYISLVKDTEGNMIGLHSMQ